MSDDLAIPRLDRAPDVAAFGGADFHLPRRVTLAFAQHWLDRPQPEFRGGEVELAWWHDRLWLHITLEDEDIFSTATGDHQRFWELGDVVEIFLRAETAEAYRELQVTPQGWRLQLRYASEQAYRQAAAAGPYDIAPYVTPGEEFDLAVRVEEPLRRWRVLASIPAETVTERAGFSLAGQRWRLSVSRYDGTRGAGAPVLSSTSRLSRPLFHAQDEWSRVTFAT